MRSSLKISALESEIARIRRKLEGRPEFSDIVAGSPEIQRAMMLARRAADLELPILIEGEPGTGKELARQSDLRGKRSQPRAVPFRALRAAAGDRRPGE